MINEFYQLINTLRYGAASDEATAKMIEVVKAVRDTGKKGSVTVKIEFKPDADQRMEISDLITASVPQKPIPSTHLFDTEKGELSESHPSQRHLDGIRERSYEPTPVRGEEAH